MVGTSVLLTEEKQKKKKNSRKVFSHGRRLHSFKTDRAAAQGERPRRGGDLGKEIGNIYPSVDVSEGRKTGEVKGRRNSRKRRKL